MAIPITYERRAVQVPLRQAEVAARRLRELGVSVRTLPDGRLTVLVRYGSKGAADRMALLQVELSCSDNHWEKVQWLCMCWRLPSSCEEVSPVINPAIDLETLSSDYEC